MSNISSLLKYRYQKRTSVVNSEDSPVVISSSSGCTISDSGSESPQIVLDAKSPIFPSKFARSADHRDTQATPVTKPPFLCETKASCSNGSPWLSKESRIAHSEQPIAKRPVVQLPSHSSSTTASYTKSDVSTFSTKSPVFSRKSPSAVSIDPGELQAKVSQLIGMFPDVDRSLLENALICTNGNVDAAEEQIIYARSPKSCNIGDKRKLVKSPDSSLFESSSKRARQLSYSDESSDIMCSSGSISPVVTNGLQHSSAEPSFFESTVLPYEKILLLQEKFPEISRHELKRVLNASDFNVDLAAETLRSYKTNEPILPTTNSSSIKAIMASRVQSKAVHTLSANTMDGCEEDDSPIKVSKKMDRRIFIVDSDSNDDAESETSKTVTTKSTNELVFDFFNVATVEEMQIMDGCSRKKAEEIAKMRPFEDWNDLVVKVESNPLVPSFILSEGREVIRLRSTVMELMERCRVISTRLESLVSDLTKRTSIDQHDNERNYVTEQPRCLSNGMSLKPYQMVGLNWLILMHNQGLNGILGDEMGLGKTIQTIAFLAYLHGEGTRTPHVIIAPSSTIDNWLRELRLWCPSLRVQLYYGTQENRRAMRAELLDGIIDEFHVLLTSYNIATGTTDDRMLFKRLKFGYAIFDEGHMLKNMSSIRFKSLMKIQAKRRLLLTGTPLQNNLLELMSLLAFLMPDMFIGKTDILKKIFVTFTGRNTGSDTSCGTYERETLAHAKNILKPFFLRRLKTEVLGQLPQKTVKSVKVPLSFEQQELYDELIAKFAPYIDQNLPPQNVNSESTKQSTAGVPGRVKEVERKLKTSNKKSVKKQRRKCDDEFSDSDSLHDGVIDDDTNDCEAVEEGKVGNERQLKQIGQSGSAYIMALRKAANHHLLHRHQYDERKLRMMAELMLEEPTHKNANVDYIYEDMQVMSDFELHKLCSQYPVLNPFRLDSETITDSGKFRHLDELLPPLKASGNRVLLFSQFTMMLDIVEEYMMSRKHKYLRLDGSTPVAERQELIDQFNADKSIFVFLLSTKAGGLGINLTAANVVILHDIDFNPYNDKQAEDRCHRVGQIREVTVYRLISKNTIEEAMLRCAEAKLRLEQNVTGTRTKESDEVDPTDVASLLKEALLMRSNS